MDPTAGKAGKDKSFFDEVLEMAAAGGHSDLEEMVIKGVEWAGNSRAFQGLLDLIPTDTAGFIGNWGKRFAGIAINKLPSKFFPSETFEHLFKSLCNEFAKNVAKLLEKKSDGSAPDDKDLNQAAKEAIKTVEERKIVILHGLAHDPVCSVLKEFLTNSESKKSVIETTFGTVAKQKSLNFCRNCFEHIEDEKRAMQAPNPATRGGRRLSPLEIVGMMSPELQKQFSDWLGSLSKKQRVRVLDDLRALDKEAEFTAFMAMDPKVRLEMLPLLEERKKQLEQYGKLIELGFTKAASILKESWTKLGQFDAQFKNEADELEKELDDLKKPQTFGQKLWALIVPSPF